MWPPGKVLAELYLAPRGITVSEFARRLGCSRKHMSRIVNGHVRIERAMACRLAAACGSSPQHWLDLQRAVMS